MEPQDAGKPETLEIVAAFISCAFVLMLLASLAYGWLRRRWYVLAVTRGWHVPDPDETVIDWLSDHQYALVYPYFPGVRGYADDGYADDGYADDGYADDGYGYSSSSRAVARSDPRDEARVRTEDALVALPRTCPRIPFPHPDAMSLLYTPDQQWISLDLHAPEFWGVFGMKRSGKGNFLQLIALQGLEFGPEVAEVWVLDPKSGLDYGFCTRLAHARLYADSSTADGSLTEGYAAAVAEMERRYTAFAGVDARNILEYHQCGGSMPFLLLIADEVGDLTKPQRAHLEKLARMAGAAGIILFVATQYPTADILSSQVQANLDNRIVLRLASAKQSAVALALGPGEISAYDPSLITDRGVAVVRQTGGYEGIGRIPEVTDSFRQQSITHLLRDYARPDSDDDGDDPDGGDDGGGYGGGYDDDDLSSVLPRHRTGHAADRGRHGRVRDGQNTSRRVKNPGHGDVKGVKNPVKTDDPCKTVKNVFYASERDFTDFFTADFLQNLPFSAEELARIASLIRLHGKQKTPVITAMPGYHPSRHRAFVRYYDSIYRYLAEHVPQAVSTA